MEIRPTARKSNLLHEMVAMSAGWLRQGHTPINVTAHAIARAAVERPLQSHAPRAQAEPAVFVLLQEGFEAVGMQRVREQFLEESTRSMPFPDQVSVVLEILEGLPRFDLVREIRRIDIHFNAACLLRMVAERQTGTGLLDTDTRDNIAIEIETDRYERERALIMRPWIAYIPRDSLSILTFTFVLSAILFKFG